MATVMLTVHHVVLPIPVVFGQPAAQTPAAQPPAAALQSVASTSAAGATVTASPSFLRPPPSLAMVNTPSTCNLNVYYLRIKTFKYNHFYKRSSII